MRTALALLLWASLAHAQVGTFDWSTVPDTFPGVQLATVSLTVPRNVNVFCLRVDTDWVDFRTTDRAPAWVAGSTETIRKTTRHFVRERRAAGEPLLAGINADGFQPWPAPWDRELPTDLTGLAISNGVLVSPPTSEPSFVVLDDGTVTMTSGLADLAPVVTAVSGFGYVLSGGVLLPGGTDMHPRTGIGLSADGRYVTLLVIDGRRHASVGATTRELAQWLLHFGAHDGLNLDGGGSSTMALFDPNAAGDGVVLVNEPVGNGIDWLAFPPSVEEANFVPTERTNGNNLGVLAANDGDADGLPDRAEARLGTDPVAPDTDRDGVPDGLEVELGTDPLRRPACADEPRTDCRQPRPRAATLELRERGDTDALRWRYAKGDDTPPGALGDPRSTTVWVACLYDAAAGPQPVARALLPAGGTCNGRSCWSATAAGGFAYADRLAAQDGIRRLRITPGSAGATTIALYGTGAYVGTPGAALPLIPPVHVQLVNSFGECWNATFTRPSVATERAFVGRSD